MEIISKQTKAEWIQMAAIDPVYFAQSVATDFDPVPSQQRMLREPLDRLISITSKRRQIGASTTLSHWLAWRMFNGRGWRAYIVAPNEFQSGNLLSIVHEIFESTPQLKDNLKASTKNSTEFRIKKSGNKCEVLLVGESGGKAKVGASIKNYNGILVFEEFNDISKAREVSSHLSPITSWGGGQFYIGTKAGFSGPFCDKFRFIERQLAAGRKNYRIFNFPLIEFIRERHGKGISIDWLRERKAEEPAHIWLREYCGVFAEGNSCFFREEDVRAAWQRFENENITWDRSKILVCGIDWGLKDATAVCYAQDNMIEDRLELIRLDTYRAKEHAKEGDIPVRSYEDIVKALVTMRDRGYDPSIVYCDKNNKGGVYSDRLKNEHGFNVVDASWGNEKPKLKALRSLRNLIQAGRFLFPPDPRILNELSRFAPNEDPETGKLKFRDGNDDVISAMAMMSTELARDERPPIFAASTSSNTTYHIEEFDESKHEDFAPIEIAVF